MMPIDTTALELGALSIERDTRAALAAVQQVCADAGWRMLHVRVTGSLEADTLRACWAEVLPLFPTADDEALDERHLIPSPAYFYGLDAWGATTRVIINAALWRGRGPDASQDAREIVRHARGWLTGERASIAYVRRRFGLTRSELAWTLDRHVALLRHALHWRAQLTGETCCVVLDLGDHHRHVTTREGQGTWREDFARLMLDPGDRPPLLLLHSYPVKYRGCVTSRAVRVRCAVSQQEEGQHG